MGTKKGLRMKFNKRSLAIGLLMLACVVQADEDHHSNATTSKTFFSVNPQFSTGRPEFLSFYHTDRMMAREGGVKGSFEIVPYGGQSNNPEALGRYFFPFQRNYMTIAEGPAPVLGGLGNVIGFAGGSAAYQADKYDLLAQNFNIATTTNSYQSRIWIKPQQSFAGVGLNYRQSLQPHYPDKGYWFDFTLPVLWVKNKVNLHESITTSGEPLPGTNANMIAAFMNPEWKFGKIAPCGRSKTGVSDIEIRIGRDSVRHHTCRYGGFIGVVCPTGNRPHGHYLWEPIIGRNHHWGFIWGSSGTFFLWENEVGDSSIRLNIDLNNNYMFEGSEFRSFDLRDKSWSRYINMYADSMATTTIPGINVLTRKLKVRPRGLYQINSSWEFHWRENFIFEVGTQLFARQTESARLACPWVEGPGIAGTALPSTPTTPYNIATRTESNANMHTWDYGLISDDVDQSKTVFTNDCTGVGVNTYIFRPIKFEDLNIQSALHPTTLGHTIYGTFGWQDKKACYPWFVSIGASSQWGVDNSILYRWSAWGKVGVSV